MRHSDNMQFYMRVYNMYIESYCNSIINNKQALAVYGLAVVYSIFEGRPWSDFETQIRKIFLLLQQKCMHSDAASCVRVYYRECFFQCLFVLKMNIQFLKNVYTQSNITLKLITRLISMYCYNDLISINGFIQGPFWDYFVNYSADLYMHTFVTITLQ